MSGATHLELMTDLARLLKKYGPEPFEQLAQEFKRADFIENLLSILGASADAGRRLSAGAAKKRQPAKAGNGVAALLQRLTKDDPEKAELLRRFYRDLSAKAVLPTVRNIRHFAEDNGLGPIKATARERAILPLFKDMATVSCDEVSRMVENATRAGGQGDRALEGWTRIILGDRHNSEAKQGDARRQG